MSWTYFPTTLEALASLQTDGYQVAAIKQAEGSIMLNELTIDKGCKLAVVFGDEVKGVD